jgi:hypothetical protein
VYVSAFASSYLPATLMLGVGTTQTQLNKKQVTELRDYLTSFLAKLTE